MPQQSASSTNSLVSDISTKTTGCNQIKGEELQYLDRHKLDCGPHKALQSFRMTGSGCSGSKQQYKYTCGATAILTTATKKTSCHKVDGKRLQHLDHHKIDCGDSQAVLSFKMTGSGCSRKKKRYKYTCGATAYSTAITKKTGCNAIDGKKLEYLDRHKMSCGDGQVLQSFHMTGEGCSGNKKRFTYKCATIVGPTPAPTQTPTAAPTPLRQLCLTDASVPGWKQGDYTSKVDLLYNPTLVIPLDTQICNITLNPNGRMRSWLLLCATLRMLGSSGGTAHTF